MDESPKETKQSERQLLKNVVFSSNHRHSNADLNIQILGDIFVLRLDSIFSDEDVDSGNIQFWLGRESLRHLGEELIKLADDKG